MASVVVSPQTATVAVGASVPLKADVLDAAGHPLSGRKVVWASSDQTIATVSSSGAVSGVAVGVVQIAASAAGKSAIAEITVNPTPVATVRLSPASRSLLIGQTLQLTAEPVDAQGAVLPGRPIAFTTSNATVATVSAAGLVTALAPGGSIITATSEGKSAVATITVASVPVASVVVTPSANPLVVGQTTQLDAEPRDASGQPLAGRPVTWSTSAAQVASVSSTGLVTALAPGAATISAVSEGKTGTATIAVSPKPVSAIIVSPGQASVTVGQTMQLAAQVTDEQGNPLSGRPISFSSGNTAVATVSGSGLVTGVAPGSATITATSEGKTGTATVTVTPVPVATVQVTPGATDVVVGQTLQLTATARSASGQELSGRTVGWSSGAPTVASVSTDGTVTGLAPGTAVIFASIDGVIGSSTITVRQVPVGSVVVTPATASAIVGEAVQLSASVRDGSGNELSGRLVGWSSSDETVAVVSSTGRVSALKVGSATITASSEGKNGTAAVTVTAPAPAPVATVSVSPSTVNLTTRGTQQITATPRDAQGNALTGRTVTWQTANSAVATVTQGGLITATGPGTTTVTATSEGKTGTVSVTVTPPPVGSVTVAPSTATVSVAGTIGLTATVSDVNGAVMTGAAVTWASDKPLIAVVSQSGVVTGLLPGTATITASSGGKSGTAAITVQLAPVASVTVSPSTLSLRDRNGERTGTLTATLRDALNNILTGRTVAWSSSNAQVATVDQSGVVTAQNRGDATITATSEGKSGTAAVNVRN